MSSPPDQRHHDSDRAEGAAREAEKNDVSLQEWMVGYQRGERAAFENLYAAISREIYGYLTTLCLDTGQVDDVFQECFLQIHRARHTYRSDLPVRPWIFGIARHVFRMHRRTLQRRRKRDALRVTVDEYIERAFERVAARELVVDALTSVGPDQREALVLHHALGWSFAEIGQLLGVRPTTAKVRAHRGMKDLRRHIDDKDNRSGNRHGQP